MQGLLREEIDSTPQSSDYITEPVIKDLEPKGSPRPARKVQKWVGKNWTRIVQLAVVLVVALSVYHYVNAPTVVRIAMVRTVSAAETIGATGKIRGMRVADLGMDTTGIIKTIFIHEGSYVTAGQPLLILGQPEMQASEEAARAGVESASAELSSASEGPLPSEIREARVQLAQAQSVGQAQIAQAEARLRTVKRGPRPQEVAEVQAALKREQDLLSKAQTDYRRIERLVKQGAIAAAQLDDARTAVSTAQASVDGQKARLSLVKSGATSDEIAEANAALREAKASMNANIATARERLNTLLANPRPQDIRAARAKVNQAQAEYTRSLNMSAKTVLKAPFSGVVADIPVEEGQAVSPGEKLIILHEMKKPIIEVETDEENLGLLAVGQKAVITADAFPGRQLNAVVTEIGSQINSERGTVKVLLRPNESATWLRPDLTVDVNVITLQSAKQIILPADCITRYDGGSAVYIVREGKAVPVQVTAGAVGKDGVVVNGDLGDGDQVVRGAANVTANSDVRAKFK